MVDLNENLINVEFAIAVMDKFVRERAVVGVQEESYDLLRSIAMREHPESMGVFSPTVDECLTQIRHLYNCDIDDLPSEAREVAIVVRKFVIDTMMHKRFDTKKAKKR